MSFRVPVYPVTVGHEAGAPLVRCTRNTALNYGNPEVDYGLLKDLYYDEVGVPERTDYCIDLINSPHLGLMGFHPALSRRRIGLNIPLCEIDKDGENALVRVAAHEAQHLKDAVNFHPSSLLSMGRVATSIGGTIAAPVLAYKYAPANEVLPDLAFASVVTLLGWFTLAKTEEAVYKINPIEIRARKVQHKPDIYDRFGEAITFSKNRRRRFFFSRDRLDGIKPLFF